MGLRGFDMDCRSGTGLGAVMSRATSAGVEHDNNVNMSDAPMMVEIESSFVTVCSPMRALGNLPALGRF